MKEADLRFGQKSKCWDHTIKIHHIFFQIIWSIIERMAAVFARAPIAIKWCIWEISSENNKEAYGCYLLSHKIWAKSDHEQMCGSHFSKQTFH